MTIHHAFLYNDLFGISFPAPLGIVLLSRIPALTTSRPQSSSLALILPHDILDRSHIVLRFPTSVISRKSQTPTQPQMHPSPNPSSPHTQLPLLPHPPV